MFKFLKLQSVLVLLISFFFMSSCTKNESTPPPPIKPDVTFSLSTITSGVDTIKNTYIFVSGFLADTGRAPITDHGFILSTDTSVLIANQTLTSSNITKISLGARNGAGGFSAKITGLVPNTRYSIASYATNSAGTGYATDKLNNAVDIKFTTKLAIGDKFGGGKVAYLFVLGEPGFIDGQLHGIIAADTDQIIQIAWDNNSRNIITGAVVKSVGAGKVNTDSVVSKLGKLYSNYFAAGVARNYVNGAYNDWYLPSKDELERLQANKTILVMLQNSYWSSTEDNLSATGGLAPYAWQVQFYPNNTSILATKTTNFAVRAVRSF